MAATKPNQTGTSPVGAILEAQNVHRNNFITGRHSNFSQRSLKKTPLLQWQNFCFSSTKMFSFSVFQNFLFGKKSHIAQKGKLGSRNVLAKQIVLNKFHDIYQKMSKS